MVGGMIDGLIGYHGDNAINIAREQLAIATGSSAGVWAAIVARLEVMTVAEQTETSPIVRPHFWPAAGAPHQTHADHG